MDRNSPSSNKNKKNCVQEQIHMTYSLAKINSTYKRKFNKSLLRSRFRVRS